MSQPWDSIYIKQSIRFPFLEFLNNHPNYIIMFYNYSKWSEDYQNTKYVMLVVPLTSGSLWPHLHFQSSKGYTHTPRRWRGKSHWTSNWYWQFYGNGQCSALSLLKLVKLHFDLKKWLFIIVLVWGPRFLFFFNIEYLLKPSISSMSINQYQATNQTNFGLYRSYAVCIDVRYVLHDDCGMTDWQICCHTLHLLLSLTQSAIK